jgi:hypothetical protein
MCRGDGYFLNAVQRRLRKVVELQKQQRLRRQTRHQLHSDALPFATGVALNDALFARATSVLSGTQRANIGASHALTTHTSLRPTLQLFSEAARRMSTNNAAVGTAATVVFSNVGFGVVTHSLLLVVAVFTSASSA